ncbi:MAG: T9SS type A sorting domain-containing protein [Bergeyella zoohelcum]|nr:T9SS type A sorting domain-containing protein [Bergeyella zoohelcum]
MKSFFTIKRISLAATFISANLLMAQDGCWKSLPRPGYLHTFGITENNTLYGWGKNTYHELADGTDVSKSTPIKIGNNAKWIKVEGTSSTQGGIQADGTLWTWGDVLGGGLTDTYTSITKVTEDTDWADLSIGNVFAMLLKKDGTLWTIGTNASGVLGINNYDGFYKTKTPVQVGTDKWKSISAGTGIALAVKEDGTLWTWGLSISGNSYSKYTPTQIGTDTDWKMASVGSSHAFAIKENGDLYGWGSNDAGEVGVGHQYAVHTPQKIGNDKWKKITAAKNTSSFGIKTDGSLWAWGDNNKSKLGLGESLSFVSTPTQVGTDTDWEDVQGALHHYSIALKTNKTLWGAGLNSSGNFGDGKNEDKIVFTKILDCPSTLSINENHLNTQINVYPNPVKDIVTIDLPHKIKSVEVFSVSGQKVFGNTSESKTINLNHLDKGNYIIKVTTDKGSFTKKIIKI